MQTSRPFGVNNNFFRSPGLCRVGGTGLWRVAGDLSLCSWGDSNNDIVKAKLSLKKSAQQVVHSGSQEIEVFVHLSLGKTCFHHHLNLVLAGLGLRCCTGRVSCIGRRVLYHWATRDALITFEMNKKSKRRSCMIKFFFLNIVDLPCCVSGMLQSESTIHTYISTCMVFFDGT